MTTTPCEHDTQADQESKKPDEKEDEKEDTPVAARPEQQQQETVVEIDVKVPNPQADPQPDERPERTWSKSHTAFETLHAEMGEVAGLAEAAFQALLELPACDTFEWRREIRTVTALFRAARDAARDSLFRSDRWIEKFEGRPVYYSPDELDENGNFCDVTEGW